MHLSQLSDFDLLSEGDGDLFGPAVGKQRVLDLPAVHGHDVSGNHREADGLRDGLAARVRTSSGPAGGME